MKIFGIIRKKTAILSACCFVLLMLVALLFFTAYGEDKNAATKEQRTAVLKGLGITAGEETVKNITVPDEFGAVYKNYNALQKEAGYDLTAYKGVKADLYTYSVKSGTEIRYYAHLLVYNGRLIGGDVCSVLSGGKMVPLKKEEILKCLK